MYDLLGYKRTATSTCTGRFWTLICINVSCRVLINHPDTISERDDRIFGQKYIYYLIEKLVACQKKTCGEIPPQWVKFDSFYEIGRPVTILHIRLLDILCN